MIRLAGVVVVLLALAGPPPRPPELRVLFIGNSLTQANDLPAMVERIGAASGAPIVSRTIAAGGFSLADHLARGEVLPAIARGGLDVVVLQQGPSALPESRVELRASVRRFDEAIRRARAKTALYMVWPSKARFADFDRVSESYRMAAKDVDGAILPAGDAWREAWTREPSLALYGPDDFHPSPLGSWLAALTITRGLSGRPVPVLTPNIPNRAGDGALGILLARAASAAFDRERER